MRTFLFDLDGTLVDPVMGIVEACQYTLDKMGRPVPEARELHWIIGPPIRTSFRQLLGDGSDVEEGVRLYRERYAAGGMCNATVYEGIEQALSELQQGDTTMFVCTAKLTTFATRIVEHFGLGGYFASIYGAELAGRFENKADLIAHMIETEGFDPELACMVGDRSHDVIAAAAHGIPTLGALWGYGSRDELTSAGAAAIVERPHHLPAAVAQLDAFRTAKA
ncbi:MAG TPA: HAD hydrolase-like protein [Rhizomicrobium sp.]|nr:HAD hydrolase-like protein [Rhizomicrobium sp.]